MDASDGFGGVDVLTVFSRCSHGVLTAVRITAAPGALGAAYRLRVGATVLVMTAKEKLRQTVEKLSEAEAQDALGFIVRRRDAHDALGALLERAPLDDEPTTAEEDEGVADARTQIARGDVLAADEIRRAIA
ncbi:MAG TPA: hypothetical protein VGF95_02130 [Solirubrobacteraceae bacterium]